MGEHVHIIIFVNPYIKLHRIRIYKPYSFNDESILQFITMSIHLHNSYKLATKEDPVHLHKVLGSICLMHYIYRYYLLLTTGTMSLRTPFAYYMVGVHGLLSCSSMIFHIPIKRNKSSPMIYPEYRLHSIVFALRSVFCYYLTYHGFPKIYNIGICFATMGFADITTHFYPSGTTTMRQMPFDSSVDVDKRTYIIMMQSFHQIGATFYMLGNEDACFTPMFAIQLAALLMTLVRKSIISANAWHLIYIFAYWSLSIRYIMLKIVLIHLFYMWRFRIPRTPRQVVLTNDAIKNTLSYDGNPSPDHLDGVLKLHPDPPAVRLNHRTPTFVPHSGVLPEHTTVIQNKYIGWSIVFVLYLLFNIDGNYHYESLYDNWEEYIRYVIIFAYCINHFYGLILPFIS